MKTELEQIAIDLAAWSKKYPRGIVYNQKIQPEMDGVLIGLEERARKAVNQPEANQPDPNPKEVVSVKARFSDEDFITNLCLSYRHDYGLLDANIRNLIRFECKEWLRAIINNWDNNRTHVFPNVP